MVNYEKMYYFLFNKITDALTELCAYNFGKASDILKTAQAETERIYIDEEPVK